MRSTASALDGVAAQIDAVKTALAAAAAAHDGCWGNDEFGEPFAEGDSGYQTRSPALQTVIDSKAGLLREYSKGLRDGATALESAETANAESFKA